MSASFSLSRKRSFNNALLKIFCKTEMVNFELYFNIFDGMSVAVVLVMIIYFLFYIGKRSFVEREIEIITKCYFY